MAFHVRSRFGLPTSYTLLRLFSVVMSDYFPNQGHHHLRFPTCWEAWLLIFAYRLAANPISDCLCVSRTLYTCVVKLWHLMRAFDDILLSLLQEVLDLPKMDPTCRSYFFGGVTSSEQTAEDGKLDSMGDRKVSCGERSAFDFGWCW